MLVRFTATLSNENSVSMPTGIVKWCPSVGYSGSCGFDPGGFEASSVWFPRSGKLSNDPGGCEDAF